MANNNIKNKERTGYVINEVTYEKFINIFFYENYDRRIDYIYKIKKLNIFIKENKDITLNDLIFEIVKNRKSINRLDELKFIIELGVDTNILDKFGFSPLYYVYKQKTILIYNTDINKYDKVIKLLSEKKFILSDINDIIINHHDNILINNIVNEVIETQNIKISNDVYFMFQFMFSKVGKIDDYLADKFSNVIGTKKGNEAEIEIYKYIINDVFKLAQNGAHDFGFKFVDAYMIWLVVMNTSPFKNYLRTEIMVIKPFIERTLGDKIQPNKKEYPAFHAILKGFMVLVSDKNKKNKFIDDMINYFNKSHIIELNMMNTYNEIVKLINNKQIILY